MKRLAAVVAICVAAVGIGGYALAGQTQPVPVSAAWVSVAQYPPTKKQQGLPPWAQGAPRVITAGDVTSVDFKGYKGYKPPYVVIAFSHDIFSGMCATTATLADNMSGAGIPFPPGFITVNGVNDRPLDGPNIRRVIVRTYDIHGKLTRLPFQLVSVCNAHLYPPAG